MCAATIPISLKLYIEYKYWSKAVIATGTFIQIGVTLFTFLKLEQIRSEEVWRLRERLREEREMGCWVEVEGLRRECERLRKGKEVMAPPTPPESDC